MGNLVRLSFERMPPVMGADAYGAVDREWQFLIFGERGQWTGSHRLVDPKQTVSASATMQGPFDSFDECADAMNVKAAELRALS